MFPKFVIAKVFAILYYKSFFSVLIFDSLSLLMSLSSFKNPTKQFLTHTNVENSRDYLSVSKLQVKDFQDF